MHFLLFYEVSPDYLERRAEFRNEHLTLAWKMHAEGALILAGEAFARADPYVKNGLVTRWHVRKWTTVAGENSTSPVRPAA